jgi:hypothetical protein
MRPTQVLAVVCVATAWACGASVQPPNDAWAAAQADVGRAQSAGADRIPDAKLHLQLAQEDLAQAKRLIGDDNGRATTLTEVARSEAQLAQSIARSSAAEDQARQAADALQKGPAAN